MSSNFIINTEFNWIDHRCLVNSIGTCRGFRIPADIAGGALRLEYRLIVYAKFICQPNTPYIRGEALPEIIYGWKT
jgi:hypothetical protein